MKRRANVYYTFPLTTIIPTPITLIVLHDMVDTKKANGQSNVDRSRLAKTIGYLDYLKPMNIVKSVYYLYYNIIQAILIMMFKPVRRLVNYYRGG